MDTGRSIGILLLILAAGGIYLETQGALIPVLGQVVAPAQENASQIPFSALVIALIVIFFTMELLGPYGGVLAGLIIFVALGYDYKQNTTSSILGILLSQKP